MSVEARDVAVGAGGRSILDGVSLSVAPGELLAVIGPNGAGKSTLVRVLSADIRPERGWVGLLGHDLAGNVPVHELAQMRAVVGPQTATDVAFTARDVVAMGRFAVQADRLHPDQERRLIDHALAAVDVAHLAGRALRTLSSGEQQRVALARALAQDTPVLLLDEPTSALDLAHQDMVMRLLLQRTGAGATVVAVLHDLNLAAAYADKVMILEHGRVAALGPPAEVLTGRLLSQVYGRSIEVVAHPFRNCPLVLTTG